MADWVAKASIIGAICTLFLVAYLGSQWGQGYAGWPIFTLCAAWVFLLNWLAFIPAFVKQTEKYYDLIGSLSYISAILLAMGLSAHIDLRSMIMGILVLIWAARLGSFLFLRIKRNGKDDRFDELKPDFFWYFNAWTLQGLWVVLTAAPALIVIAAEERIPFGVFGGMGLFIWVIGFIIEVVADHQKSTFRKEEANREKFIQSGLWSKSRHPNYFGEIMLWVGMLIMAIPVLQGGQWIAYISPIFITLLLTKISGIPMLERKAEQKWGGNPDYEAYKANTPVLIPKFW